MSNNNHFSNITKWIEKGLVVLYYAIGIFYQFIHPCYNFAPCILLEKKFRFILICIVGVAWLVVANDIFIMFQP